MVGWLVGSIDGWIDGSLEVCLVGRKNRHGGRAGIYLGKVEGCWRDLSRGMDEGMDLRRWIGVKRDVNGLEVRDD